VSTLWAHIRGFLMGKCSRFAAIATSLVVYLALSSAPALNLRLKESAILRALQENRSIPEIDERSTRGAIEIYARAIDAGARHAVLAECAEELNRAKATTQSAGAWRMLVQLQPGNPEYLCNLARYHWLYGRQHEALVAVKIALTIQPRNAVGWEMLAHWTARHQPIVDPVKDYAERAVMEADAAADVDAQAVRDRLDYILRPSSRTEGATGPSSGSPNEQHGRPD